MSIETAAMQQITDEDTARRSLNRARVDLGAAVDVLAAMSDGLRDKLVDIRPMGLLTVGEMAQAIGRTRNYVDSVWSAYGATVRGRQTRVPVAEGTDPEAARQAYEALVDAGDNLKRAQAAVTTARAERDRVVSMVYASKVLGPSAIAAEVGIDRNHVFRISRKAGISPVHRHGTKNQYTSK